jgi:hypothetical protein
LSTAHRTLHIAHDNKNKKKKRKKEKKNIHKKGMLFKVKNIKSIKNKEKRKKKKKIVGASLNFRVIYNK